MRSERRTPNIARAWLLLGLLGLAGAIGLVLRPASEWLRRATPDGVLDPGTSGFIDTLWILIGFFGVMSIACGLSSSLRNALAGAWQEPRVAGSRRAWIPAIAVGAGLLRVVLARYSDIGLGDDGARVAWLERWLQDPHPIWSGYWAPGHLYLHAALRVVLGDAVWAGAVLSALACVATVWILGRGIESVWGSTAALLGASMIALAPVSMAYGATPDVNPVFAGLVTGCVAATLRTRRGHPAAWLALAWICFAFAAWSRFEAFALIPAIAILLWPRRRLMIVFAVALLSASLGWLAADWIATGRAARVVRVVQNDPALVGSHASSLFGFLGGMWRCITPVGVVLGAAGIGRALRARSGREWFPLAALHVAVLAAAMWTSGTGTQSRYFILAAAILFAYSGAALAGIARRSWRIGAAGILLAAVGIGSFPSLFPDGNDLWVRRDPRLRGLVDRVAANLEPGDHILWLANEAPYLFLCRTRIGIERYHATTRGDDDVLAVAAELRRSAPLQALACVHQANPALGQWETLAAELAPQITELEPPLPNYRLFRLRVDP